MTIDHTNIDALLERFFEGETTCAEERALEQYFASGDVPEHVRQYADMFAWYSAGMPEEAEVNEKPAVSKVKRLIRPAVLWWSGIAAALAIVFAAGWNYHKQSAKERLMAAAYEGSYTEINGVICTDLDLIINDINAANLEARAIALELEAAELELQAAALEQSEIY